MSPTPIAIAVVCWEDRFLVRKRPEGAVLAGYWEFPGGKVEAGETPAEAAVRECQEESGLAITVAGLHQRLTYEYDYDTIDLHFFDCRRAENVSSPEGSFVWVARDELSALRFPPANDSLLAELTKSL